MTEKKINKEIVTRDMKTFVGGCLTKEGHSKLVRTTLVWLGNQKIEKYMEKKLNGMNISIKTAVCMYVFKAFANQKKFFGIFLQCFFKNSEVLERSRAPVLGIFSTWRVRMSV